MADMDRSIPAAITKLIDKTHRRRMSPFSNLTAIPPGNIEFSTLERHKKGEKGEKLGVYAPKGKRWRTHTLAIRRDHSF